MSAAHPSTVRATVVGATVVDVLVRPVDRLPSEQISLAVDEIVMTPAGTAAGTAVGLAKLGARVRLHGATGNDLIGTLLRASLSSYGIDVTGLTVVDGVQTGTTVLPINSHGVRPAWRVTGAMAEWSSSDLADDAFALADLIVLGGPDVVTGIRDHRLIEAVAAARSRGAIVVMDLLRRTSPDGLASVSGLLRHVDWFLPNDDQLTDLTSLSDPIEAARALISGYGVRGVAVTMGAEGAAAVTATSVDIVDAFDVDVRDTTGCGDAFAAAFSYSIAAGRSVRDALVMGSAAGSLTATRLGSLAGFEGPDDLERLVATSTSARFAVTRNQQGDSQ